MPTESSTSIALPGLSWPAAAAIIAAGAIVLWFTWRSLRRAGDRRWAGALLAMRTAALLALAFALLQPEMVTSTAELVKNRIVVLCDGSLSMDLPSGVEGKSRQQVVSDALGKAGGVLDRLGGAFDLAFVEFGDGTRGGTAEAVSRTHSGGMGRTDLRAALRAVQEQHLGEALQAVVLVTDGADTEMPEDENARRQALADRLAAIARPVFVFCPATTEGIRDVGITAVRCSGVGFVRRRWEADVELTVVGLSEGTLTVLLRSGETIVDLRRVALQPGRSRYSVTLGFTPIRPALMPLSLEVQPHPAESYQPNNYAGLLLSVVRDKIRVLQVAGRPSWDVRFLRRMLEQTPTVDLVSFFIMRDVTDDPGVPTPNSYVNLIPFPTDELFTRELRTFDVIIFQNFDYRLFEMYPQNFVVYLQNIREHVSAGGAGFVMIGGEQSFDRGHYEGTPLEAILPVKLAGASGLVDERQFRARLTAAGRRHPLTRVEPDEKENAALWEKMPELIGCHVLPAVKEDAVVLLEHPDMALGGRNLPIVAIASAGSGRVMAVTTDETWKWHFLAAGEGPGNRLYLRFWQNALRWLAGELESPRLSLSLSHRAVSPAEKVHGVVRAAGEDFGPRARAKVSVSVRRVGGADAPAAQFELTTDEEGKAVFEFAPADAGLYRAEAHMAEGGPPGQADTLQASTLLVVEVPGRELKDLRPDEGLLKWIATQSGGEFHNIARGAPPQSLPIKPKKVERLLRREVRPLWNNWITYGLFVGILCAEWWLRRRRGVT